MSDPRSDPVNVIATPPLLIDVNNQNGSARKKEGPSELGTGGIRAGSEGLDQIQEEKRLRERVRESKSMEGGRL